MPFQKIFSMRFQYLFNTKLKKFNKHALSSFFEILNHETQFYTLHKYNELLCLQQYCANLQRTRWNKING